MLSSIIISVQEQNLKKAADDRAVMIGVDTGGTFTDFVYILEGEIRVLKILSTPANPGLAIFEGLDRIQENEPFEYSIIHGSTVATNALLERRGKRTALITTKGFKDLIEIGRQNREDIYDLNVDRPSPLVSAKYRYEIGERTTHTGNILKKVDQKELKEIIDKLRKNRIESVAVCFLHSYIDQTNENTVADRVRKEGFNVSPSSEILPEYREYERFSTTVVNAYVAPIMDKYINSIQKNLSGIKLRIMKSNGGVITADTARKESVNTILSGPAGGVVGGYTIGKKAGFSNLITFDMGGTSTDVALCPGNIVTSAESKVAGFPIKVPIIDIHTVGAGGGSIASMDAGGALKVGPESSGSDPGPVCYGKGTRLTVTDANLALGRLDAAHFLGGSMKIYHNKMTKVLKKTAKEYRITPDELSSGIIRIVNSSMEKALRVISIEKGYNPAEFALVSYGGAGSLHAAELAKDLNIQTVIIPLNPGIYSAMGMLFSDFIKDYSRTILIRADDRSYTAIDKKYIQLEKQAMKEMLEEDVPADKIKMIRMVDVRYRGQSYELTVPFKKDYVTGFHKAHKKRYGFSDIDRMCEVVNIRIRCVGSTKHPKIVKETIGKYSYPRSAVLGKREIYNGKKFIKTGVFDRAMLGPGSEIKGPAVIHEYSSTTYVPPDFILRIDGLKNMILTMK
ncbi:MAG: hydantoinase/oxoprolinase family protein [bacterium]|nr:hydantoinase/oxoprolinase family protein [bacterium]